MSDPTFLLTKQEWNELAILRVRKANRDNTLEAEELKYLEELLSKLRESSSDEFKEYCGYKKGVKK